MTDSLPRRLRKVVVAKAQPGTATVSISKAEFTLTTSHGHVVRGLSIEQISALLQAFPMIGSSRALRVFAYAAPCDMRKGYNGLEAIVRKELARDITDGELYRSPKLGVGAQRFQAGLGVTIAVTF